MYSVIVMFDVQCHCHVQCTVSLSCPLYSALSCPMYSVTVMSDVQCTVMSDVQCTVMSDVQWCILLFVFIRFTADSIDTV